MKFSELLFLTIIFILLSFIDSQLNFFLISFLTFSNITYLFLCYLCFRNPQKINSLFGAYIGFIIDLHQNVFFGLHATLFTLTILLINYNYFRLRMFSTLQTTLVFSFFTAFFVGFKSILLTTMNFQYLVVFLSFFSAFITYLFVPSLGKLSIKRTKL
jgi:rod shape-determining protein MreD